MGAPNLFNTSRLAVLQHHAPAFTQLGSVCIGGMDMPWAEFSALLACPMLAEMEDIGSPAESSMGMLDSMPPALQQLKLGI